MEAMTRSSTPGSGRIILKDDTAPGAGHTLTGAALDALSAWKPRAGEAVTVSSPAGRLYRARVVELCRTHAKLLVFEEAGARQDGPRITLLQALPEKERMELIIQKTAELGVDAVVPVKTGRSISLEEKDALQKKSHRWQDIALKAAKQSRRESIPQVLPLRPLNDALKECAGAGFKIALVERPGLKPLKDALGGAKGKAAREAVVLTGPEGGFDGEELRDIIEAGFLPVSLGNRILRTETASIISVGLLRYELG